MSDSKQLTVYRMPGPRIIERDQVQRIGDEIGSLLVSERGLWIALDFGDVEAINSIALGMLVSLRGQVKARGGQMVLMGIVSEGIAKVIETTRLASLFPIASDEGAALEACRNPTLPFWLE